MKKIAFVLPNLSGGGAARVATILTNEWVEAGQEVHLITFEESGADSVYSVDQRVQRRQIGFSKSPHNAVGMMLNNFRRIHTLRKHLQSIGPDVVVSFLLEANVASVFASKGLALPSIIGERNHPEHDRISAIRGAMRAFAYPRADKLSVQTSDVRDWYSQKLGIDSTVIPNPAPQRRNRPTPTTIGPKSGERYRAVCLGRLERQKGFDRLITAFSHVADQAKDWDLIIFGEGSDRPSLEALIINAGLQDRITLPGVTASPESALDQADLFIHASHYEGYPNALIEALAADLCVVATDSPGASAELLGGGEFGVLAPNSGPDELAMALLPILVDHEKRCAFARKASQALVPLAADIIARRWLREFQELWR